MDDAHDSDDVRDRLNDQIERLKIALVDVKMLVVGAAPPRWDNSFETTTTRERIADICDRALGIE
jgi:hypothetical protein